MSRVFKSLEFLQQDWSLTARNSLLRSTRVLSEFLFRFYDYAGFRHFCNCTPYTANGNVAVIQMCGLISGVPGVFVLTSQGVKGRGT